MSTPPYTSSGTKARTVPPTQPPPDKRISLIEDGSVTSPSGFRAAGAACGLKRSGKADLALLVSDCPAAAAGVFTSNQVRAACVDINRERIVGGKAQAIVVNSGNANCFTGQQGFRDALEMNRFAGEVLGVDEELVLGASTGVIGEPLPLDNVKQGISSAAELLSHDGGQEAALAIMTTDTIPKALACEVSLTGGDCHIGIIAKGSGMIEPNLATMLAFVTTDANVEARVLDRLLRLAVDSSINCVTIDGDASTNDMAVALANGASGVQVGPEDEALFGSALAWVCREMAKLIAFDGEGATKLVEVTVAGAASGADAKLAAKTIANSPLVKTAIFGSDPNWGRILAAAGRSGCRFDQNSVSLSINGTQIVRSGEPVRLEPDVRRGLLAGSTVEISVDLGIGGGSCTVWTCDLSYDYVKINAEYHT